MRRGWCFWWRTASLVVGRDDSARQTTPEAHPHPALRATFPLEGGRSREEGEPQNLPPKGGRWRRSRRMRGRLETGKRSKPVSFSLPEKERFLESKEKGAPVGVEWFQIGIRRPGFTPPLCTSTVHRRLRRWNRETLWFYPHFFRRLRGRASERGAAAWYFLYCRARLSRRAHSTT